MTENNGRPSDWTEDAMQLDAKNPDKSGEFENALETLNSATAESAQPNQSAQDSQKGKFPDDVTNEDDFIQIPRSTKYHPCRKSRWRSS